MLWLALLWVLLAWGSAAPALVAQDARLLDPPGGPFALDLPLACQVGETCWVANYVDVDPGNDAKDFRCHGRTDDAHDGTDFAIRDRAVMEQGIPVLAGAPGVVRRVRDGMEDQPITDDTSRARIAGRECGNGVMIDHAGGWQTQYCHLRRGSVQVRVGERVDRGSQLGLVGLSGKTEFPHVHVTVRHHGRVVDPFTGQWASAGCGLGGKPLWRDDAHISYEEVALYNAGFSGEPPNVEAIRGGRNENDLLSSAAKALVLWVDIFGVQAGDTIRFRIIGPDGKLVLDHETRIDRTQARRFVFAGRGRQTGAWQAGSYVGKVTLLRSTGGQQGEQSVTRRVTIESGRTKRKSSSLFLFPDLRQVAGRELSEVPETVLGKRPVSVNYRANHTDFQSERVTDHDALLKG
ncbi:MAG TPA: M23 family metallopeptidase [Nitrospiraceae bacterium]|jgi:murein DD-endopeptidase MepM/ murein hydrolase activator NlpD|nr:M23 family metallopeptidase [Nitrospiraceae bacterium]